VSYEYPEVDNWTKEELGIGEKPEGIYNLRIESAEVKRGKSNPDSENVVIELSFRDDPVAGTITHYLPLPSMAKDSDFDPKGLKSNNFKKLLYRNFIVAFGFKDGKKPSFDNWVGKEASINVGIEVGEYQGRETRKNVLNLGSF